jgi:hypothetical protein
VTVLAVERIDPNDAWLVLAAIGLIIIGLGLGGGKRK